MDQLPFELIEEILSSKTLSIEDIVNFSATSKYFRASVLTSTLIWKHKFYDKWPMFVNLFDKSYNNFLYEMKYLHELRRKIVNTLQKMSSLFYKRYQLSDSDFEEWYQLISEKEQTYNYLVFILLDIISSEECIKSIEVVPLNTPGNKTLQYYASKVLTFIKHLHLSKLWKKYVNFPPKQQTLEKGAIFVAQWCQTDLEITEQNIASELDSMVNLVRQKLFSINPQHQLFKATKMNLDIWKLENVEKSQWNIVECRQIIVAMREVIYMEMGFCGNSENYYKSENSLINKVLETRKGLPIILAVIYESVGRRLGLRFDPINFPAHFLLRFTEGEGLNQSVYYIDTFNGGDIMQKTSCPYSTPVPREVRFPVATAVQVVTRIVNNLELSTRQHIEPNGRVSFLRAILELLILVNPQDMSAVVSLAKLYSLHKINPKSLESFIISQPFIAPDQIESILAMLRGVSKSYIENGVEFETPVVQRSSDLKYAVGMIMIDIIHRDKCVIYGWNIGGNSATNAHSVNYNLISRPRQPYYNVLVEDGSYRYVPQEVLMPTTEVGLLLHNKDLGRHFSHFFENHFVPNAEKEKEYPYDTKIRQKFYHEMQLAHYKP